MHLARKRPAAGTLTPERRSTALQTGLAYLHACKYKEAAKDLRRAAAEEPGAPTVRAYLAAALFHAHDFDSALIEADAAIALSAHDAQMQLLRGRCLEALHRDADASEAYQAVVRLDPSLKEARLGLSEIARRRGDDRGAEAALEEAAVYDPYDRTLLLALADLRERRGNIQGAIDAIQWALSLNARDPDHFMRLARLHEQTGNLDNAVDAMRGALQLSTLHPSRVYVLAKLLVRQRKYGDVLALYESAMQHDSAHRDRYVSDLQEHTGTFLLAEAARRERPSDEILPGKPLLTLLPPVEFGDGAESVQAPQAGPAPDSIEYLEEAVSADPANSRLRRDLSIRYLKEGRLVEARRETEYAERLAARRSIG